MTTLLVIEDDEPKLDQIQSHLLDCFPDFTVLVASSSSSAIRTIEAKAGEIDGILLDMSLPNFNGGKTTGSFGRQKDLGGKELLQFMWELEFNIPVYVITGFSDFADDKRTLTLADLHHLLAAQYSEIYRGYTKFEHNSDSWKASVTEFIIKYVKDTDR